MVEFCQYELHVLKHPEETRPYRWSLMTMMGNSQAAVVQGIFSIVSAKAGKE
jgi:hypothetical protein